MSAVPLSLKLGEDGAFERQFVELTRTDDGAADLLRGHLEAFAQAPESRGFFLRGAPDGRKRYLVPAGCGTGLLERAVAVVEVRPQRSAAVLLRLYTLAQVGQHDVRSEETRRADLELDI